VVGVKKEGLGGAFKKMTSIKKGPPP